MGLCFMLAFVWHPASGESPPASAAKPAAVCRLPPRGLPSCRRLSRPYDSGSGGRTRPLVAPVVIVAAGPSPGRRRSFGRAPFQLRRRPFKLTHAAARPGGPRGPIMATFDASAARGLLADGGWRRWALVASLARMPAVMAPFGLLLAGHEATGSYADGAWMVSVYAAGAA